MLFLKGLFFLILEPLSNTFSCLNCLKKYIKSDNPINFQIKLESFQKKICAHTNIKSYNFLFFMSVKITIKEEVHKFKVFSINEKVISLIDFLIVKKQKFLNTFFRIKIPRSNFKYIPPFINFLSFHNKSTIHFIGIDPPKNGFQIISYIIKNHDILLFSITNKKKFKKIINFFDSVSKFENPYWVSLNKIPLLEIRLITPVDFSGKSSYITVSSLLIDPLTTSYYLEEGDNFSKSSSGSPSFGLLQILIFRIYDWSDQNNDYVNAYSFNFFEIMYDGLCKPSLLNEKMEFKKIYQEMEQYNTCMLKNFLLTPIKTSSDSGSICFYYDDIVVKYLFETAINRFSFSFKYTTCSETYLFKDLTYLLYENRFFVGKKIDQLDFLKYKLLTETQ